MNSLFITNLFAFALIIFIIKFDWSGVKISRWAPYVFVVILAYFILFSCFKFLGIDLVSLLGEQNIRQAIVESLLK